MLFIVSEIAIVGPLFFARAAKSIKGRIATPVPCGLYWEARDDVAPTVPTKFPSRSQMAESRRRTRDIAARATRQERQPT
jgi:hypothetical protein